MPVRVKLFKQSVNETLEGTTPGLEPEDAPIGATTSNTSRDQQAVSSKGFQLICAPYKLVYCL